VPNKKKLRNIIWILITTAVLMVLLLLCYRTLRGHGKISVSVESFTESSKKMSNPNCGFYYINDFKISDDYFPYREEVAERFANDEETSLSLIEINISEYKDGPISEEGLKNIDQLMVQLERYDKQYIIRVLYDWDGKASEHEPKKLETVLMHMEQIGPILTAHKDCIFTLQGLFVGNWGEMNGTPYTDSESLELLYNKLAAVTPDDMYLAVRTPNHWRSIADIYDVDGIADSDIAKRLGLYNDGMLGSKDDCGTYTSSTRDEELIFQETLCAAVPQGGEVIRNNEYNDFDNALNDMKQMHVSYLNRGYDLDVLSKWNNTTIDFDEPYNGMMGLDYIERHLGYRLVLDEVSMDASNFKDCVSMKAYIKNVGFAPVYKSCELWVTLYNEEDGYRESYLLETDVRGLAGGNYRDDRLEIEKNFHMFGKTSGDYQIYLNLVDVATGTQIQFANEQDITAEGYLLGTITLK